MNIRMIRLAVFAAMTIAATSGAASAQSGGTMGSPMTGGAMSSDQRVLRPAQSQTAGCDETKDAMSGHMLGGADNHMSGGNMANGNDMADGAMANNAGCQRRDAQVRAIAGRGRDARVSIFSPKGS